MWLFLFLLQNTLHNNGIELSFLLQPPLQIGTWIEALVWTPLVEAHQFRWVTAVETCTVILSDRVNYQIIKYDFKEVWSLKGFWKELFSEKGKENYSKYNEGAKKKKKSSLASSILGVLLCICEFSKAFFPSVVTVWHTTLHNCHCAFTFFFVAEDTQLELEAVHSQILKYQDINLDVAMD